MSLSEILKNEAVVIFITIVILIVLVRIISPSKSKNDVTDTKKSTDKLKSTDLDKLKSTDLDKLKSTDLDKLKSVDLDKLKSTDLDKLKSTDLDKLKSTDLDKLKSTDKKMEKIEIDENELKKQFLSKSGRTGLYSADSNIDIVSTGGKVNLLSTNGGIRAISTNGDAALMTTNGNVGTISLNGSFKTLSGLDTYIMTKGIDKDGVIYQPNINLVPASDKIGLGLSKRYGFSQYDYNDNNKEMEEDTRLGIYWGNNKPTNPAPSGSIYLDRTGDLWIRKESSWKKVALI